MREAQFQKKVIAYLKALPHTYHVKIWGGGFQTAGIPDILCCIKGYFVAIELKTENGKTSKLQDYNIDKIKQAHGFAIVLRPSGFEEFKNFVSQLG